MVDRQLSACTVAMSEELEPCGWQDYLAADSFSACVRPKDHDGEHVIASQTTGSVNYYEVMMVDEKTRAPVIRPWLHVDVVPGPKMDLEELVAIWAVTAGRSDYVD